MATQDLIGRTLGKYQILARLGRGGMAEVYKAFQPSLDRYVAVKVLHSFMAEDKEFLGRFRREAKNVAALRHPNIVQVFDFDVQDELYYMVMEYLDGPTLRTRLEALHQRGERLPLGETLRIIRDVGSALAYAHAHGVVHRDVKPANVILETSGRVILTDFGVAKMLTGTQYTQAGTVLGTPAYMSPEQGQGQPGDGRSDIYSLGVMLYEMATGRLPYDADTPLAVVMKHVHDPLPLPRSVLPELPESVERVILRALAKDPAERYDRVETMLADLEGVERGLQAPPATARPPTGPAAAPAAPKRSRAALAVGGGLGVFLCLGGIVVVGLVAVGSGFTDRLVGGRATASPTAVPPPPTLTPGPVGEILLEDDFADPSTGWDRVSDSTGGTDYQDGAYRIWLDEKQQDRWANPGESFTDVRIDVDATKAGGPDDNDFGVICRYIDNDNFYAFWISSDGYYGIVRYLKGEFQVLGAEGMQPHNVIAQGEATNHLRAECVGSTLRLYVNNELLDKVEDSSHSEGDVGLMAGTFDVPGVDIRFDNFVVRAP
ncbi:MAG TPA: protein kinase [Anaerolineales bacterium]|nr:protein kinase [Anaerolineales bacterium]